MTVPTMASRIPPIAPRIARDRRPRPSPKAHPPAAPAQVQIGQHRVARSLSLDLPLLREPFRQRSALVRVELAKGLIFRLRALSILLVEEALDHEHPSEPEEGIEAKGLARRAERPAPVPDLEIDVAQPFVEHGGPGIERDGPLRGGHGRSNLASLDGVR